MGMMIALAVVWIIAELIHGDKEEEEKKQFSVSHVLQRIDMPSILFFLGILLAVAALESLHVLAATAGFLETTLGNQNVIVLTIGALSAIVDNIPVVAATMGMYPLSKFPMDDHLWEMLAFAAGTGGSMLLIGSAAGVMAAGMEKGITFGWYLRNIAPLATLGYLAGMAWLVFV